MSISAHLPSKIHHLQVNNINVNITSRAHNVGLLDSHTDTVYGQVTVKVNEVTCCYTSKNRNGLTQGH